MGNEDAMSDMNKQIEQRVHQFVSELTALVRQAAVDAVASALGSAPARAAAGRPVSGATTAKKSAGRGAPATRGKRSAAQIALAVSSVHSYMKAHPNSRSENIRNALKMPRPVMRDALDRLIAANRIRMKGVKRAATYTAV